MNPNIEEFKAIVSDKSVMYVTLISSGWVVIFKSGMGLCTLIPQVIARG